MKLNSCVSPLGRGRDLGREREPRGWGCGVRTCVEGAPLEFPLITLQREEPTTDICIRNLSLRPNFVTQKLRDLGKVTWSH